MSSEHVQEIGVPQGAILSVTLFILALTQAVQEFPSFVEPFLFVDDITIAFRAKTSELAVPVLQNCIDKLSAWASSTGLTFSASKTKCVLFSRQRKTKFRSKLELKLYGQKIPLVDEVKYLGLIFDKKLSWKSHIEHVRIKCMKDLNLLRQIQAYKWGADRASLLYLYCQIIRSKIDYGCTVYGSSKPKFLARLDAVHNAGIRLATGAFKTSPIESLLVEANEPSLSARRDLLLLRYGHRILQFPDNMVYPLLKSTKFTPLYENRNFGTLPFYLRFNNLLNFYKLTQLPQPSFFWQPDTPPWTVNKPKMSLNGNGTKAQTAPGVYALEHRSLSSANYNMAKFYTDGSKTEQGSGCAFTHGSTMRQYSCTRQSSICTVELEGISQAIHYAAVEGIKTIVVYSDSLSSLQALGKLYSENQTVLKIRQCLYDNGINAQFFWVAGHSGIPGNEKADRLAQTAILDGLQIQTPVYAKDLYVFINKALKEVWQKNWNSCRENKLRAIKNIILKWTTAHRQNRHEENILCRLRIGHTRLTHSYLFSTGKEVPKCRQCNAVLTVTHIICDCPGLQDLRAKHQVPTAIQEALCDDEEVIRRVLLYLKEAGLLEEL